MSKVSRAIFPCYIFKFSHSLLTSSLLIKDRIHGEKKADYIRDKNSKKPKE